MMLLKLLVLNSEEGMQRKLKRKSVFDGDQAFSYGGV
uniref:Uncharacterized protein n=1 Tax=Medicago truncatula TaxID=3880 RepID=Q2HSW0_MEDTR|nr:hypothetical protein MtrDRAFT_AC150891g16v2 [Medicago truncatula]